jgi:hypothetical protein
MLGFFTNSMETHMKVDGFVLPLAAIATISFGALFFHYQPHTSADMAAWVQAVFSVIAIVATVATVHWQTQNESRARDSERTAQNRVRIELVIRVAAEATDCLTHVCENTATNVLAREYMTAHSEEELFGAILAALQAVPIWELPSSELLTPLLIVRKAFSKSYDAMRMLRKDVPGGFFGALEIAQMPARMAVVEQTRNSRWALKTILTYAERQGVRLADVISTDVV